MQPCDHKSVGILVFNGSRLLLIDRKRQPLGWAPPAGHVDESASFEDAARRELFEEVGLTAIDLRLVADTRRNNTCRRGGKWHHWKIYVARTTGSVQLSRDETKGFGWFLPEEIDALIASDLLEPVWHKWLKNTDDLLSFSQFPQLRT